MNDPAPHTSRHTEANGLKLHYLDYGSAGRPAMLCLYGAPRFNRGGVDRGSDVVPRGMCFACEALHTFHPRG